MFEDHGPVYWGIWIRGAPRCPLDPPGALGPADDTDGVLLEDGILRVPLGWGCFVGDCLDFPNGKKTPFRGIHREDVLFWGGAMGKSKLRVIIPFPRDRKWKTVLSAKSK